MTIVACITKYGTLSLKHKRSLPSMSSTKNTPVIDPDELLLEATTETHEAAATPLKPTENEPSKFGQLRSFFLYVLIGGLVISAIISIFAILIGEFNEVIQKALLTTFIFMSHSLLVLAVISSDKYNQIGKSLLPTVVLGAIVANMVTTTFSTWGIWSGETSWKAFNLYILLIGGAFLIEATMKLALKHKATTYAVNTTVVAIGLLTIALIPWIFVQAEDLGSFYFRLVSALTVFAGTALSITVILNRIALATHADLRAAIVKPSATPQGLLAIYIVVGTITAFFWFYGFIAFVSQAAHSNIYDNPSKELQYNQRYY